MSRSCEVTVVLSTRNREHLLGPALKCLEEQAPATPPYEVLVVDNGSSDLTQAIVEQHAVRTSGLVRLISEPRQGLSYARNAGIAAASAPLIAFTDDDVLIGDEWVRVIYETFQTFAEVDCLGGRTLPVWPQPPPDWLTPLHWVGPLALQDYGDFPLIVDARHPLCLAGANFAFRRSVFSRIGLFSPAFPRAQDTQFLLRMYRAGGRALYVPDMLVHSPVDAERLTKQYHRRWHRNVGRCNARMGLEELSDPLLGLRPSAPEVRRLWGVPLFALRQFGTETAAWLKSVILRRKPEAFLHETRLQALVGYTLQSHALRGRDPGTARDAISGPPFTDRAAGVSAGVET